MGDWARGMIGKIEAASQGLPGCRGVTRDNGPVPSTEDATLRAGGGEMG